MNNKLNEKEKKLYKAVDEVLFYLWDPIGVSDQSYARDEYYSYVPNIFSLLLQTKDGSEIKEKLIEIERDNMGLVSNKINAKRIVELLLDYKYMILEDESR